MTTSSSPTVSDRLRRLPIDRGTIGIWARVLTLEALILTAYFVLTDSTPAHEIRYLVYPFVWINVGVWAVVRTDPVPGNRPHRLLARTIAAGYLLAVLAVPGNLGLGTPGGSVDVRVVMHAPGWGPLVAFASPWVRLFLVPFEVIGYASLAYLVYANLLVVTRGTLSGLLGLVTCVGCTVPVLVPLLGLLGGPATGLTTTAYAWSYDLGTLLFVLTVGLLYWSHRRDRS